MAKVSIERPFYPIVYVRGYAGTEAAVEETVATPYMGFNLGSTKVRQTWEKKIVRYIFESPLVRLMKEHGYRDVYEAGVELAEDHDLSARCVVIYRYYDVVSEDLGTGDRPEIEAYADGLGQLIERVRDRLCGDDAGARGDFKVILVAHSMGGLICRCFLQNDRISKPETKALVDKVFTYATPHNGIDVKVLGNVPAFFSSNNSENFNRDRMGEYLDLSGDQRVDRLDGKFDPRRFFCLVGTNHKDYDAASGWARRVVGPMSDGLVRIANATVKSSPRAFVHRSHSGDFGIVNSEEGFQNLSRFLFGDVRVDGVLHVDALTLPPKVARAHRDGKEIRASYHFEVVVRTRGARYDLHRRLVEEGSAIFRTFDEMMRPDRAGLDAPRHPHLFSTFLSVAKRTKTQGALVFGVDLRVLVPEYEIDGFLLFDDHIEGSYLYRDSITMAALPPRDEKSKWSLRYGYDSNTPGRVTREADVREDEGRLVFEVPIVSTSKPGITARLELTARPWNRSVEA